MKKFASLLLTVVLLAAMFCVFSIPASADELILDGEKILTIASRETKIITESEEYDQMYVYGALVLGENAQLTTGNLSIKTGGKFLLQQGATVTAKKISLMGYPLFTVPSGVTIKAELFELPNELTLAPGAVVEAKKLMNASHLTVSSGATLITSGGEPGLEIDLYGTMKSSEFEGNIISKVHYHKGALLDITFKDSGKIMSFISMVDGEGVEDAADSEVFIKNGNRVYIHLGHAFNNACANCGEGADDGTGSTLSEGSLAVICSVACLAVGFLAAMFIFKKKKPTAANNGE